MLSDLLSQSVGRWKRVFGKLSYAGCPRLGFCGLRRRFNSIDLMHGQRQCIRIFSSGKAVEEISKGQKRDTEYGDVKEREGGEKRHFTALLTQGDYSMLRFVP